MTEEDEAEERLEGRPMGGRGAGLDRKQGGAAPVRASLR